MTPLRVRLVVLTDTTQYPDPERTLSPLLERAAPGRVVVVLRDRELAVRSRLALGRGLGSLCQRAGQFLVVAERLDLGRLLGAAGVHLPDHGLTGSRVRATLPQGAWLSRACHEGQAVEAADLDATTALLVSPACAPRKGRPALGVEAWARLAGRLRARNPGLLLYPLGGVGPDQIPALLAAGASGAAVIGSGHAPDPGPLLASLGIAR